MLNTPIAVTRPGRCGAEGTGDPSQGSCIIAMGGGAKFAIGTGESTPRLRRRAGGAASGIKSFSSESSRGRGGNGGGFPMGE